MRQRRGETERRWEGEREAVCVLSPGHSKHPLTLARFPLPVLVIVFTRAHFALNYSLLLLFFCIFVLLQ